MYVLLLEWNFPLSCDFSYDLMELNCYDARRYTIIIYQEIFTNISILPTSSMGLADT